MANIPRNRKNYEGEVLFVPGLMPGSISKPQAVLSQDMQ
jgi:hypothetical protein